MKEVVLYAILALGWLTSTASTSRRLSISEEAYLERYGYYLSPIADGKERSDDDLREGLLLFQSLHNLEETGTMTSETIVKMSLPRCGFKDLGDPDSNLRFSVYGVKWLSTSLKYSYLNYSADMSENDTRETIEAAFKIWSDVTPLEFTEVDETDNPEIYILFQGGDHGDGSPFDGPGGVFAHAFPPGAGYGGDAHFDGAEDFTINGAPGIDLFQVAAHEFGHSLGLNHSTDPTALMTPFNGRYIANFQLPQDDIDGIQFIYGPNPDAPYTTANPVSEHLDNQGNCLCIRRKPEI